MINTKEKRAGKFPKAVWRSKRGSAQVEAAVVLPLVILAVISSVWIMAYFYMQTAARSGIHLALRCEAGVLSGTVLCAGDERTEELPFISFSAERVKAQLTEKATSCVKEMGLASVPELSGKYQRSLLFSTLSLNFQKEYRNAGLYRPQSARGGTSVQYVIDEAQWIRNWDLVRNEILEKENTE